MHDGPSSKRAAWRAVRRLSVRIECRITYFPRQNEKEVCMEKYCEGEKNALTSISVPSVPWSVSVSAGPFLPREDPARQGWSDRATARPNVPPTCRIRSCAPLMSLRRQHRRSPYVFPLMSRQQNTFRYTRRPPPREWHCMVECRFGGFIDSTHVQKDKKQYNRHSDDDETP